MISGNDIEIMEMPDMVKSKKALCNKQIGDIKYMCVPACMM